eukprot:9332610-Ditylum_brightwellii.AAC.1
MRTVYKNGGNSLSSDDQPQSLATLSTTSFPRMSEDPMYNYFRYTFRSIGQDEEGERLGVFDDEPVEQYGDTLVTDLMELNQIEVVKEAPIVTNVWMTVTHHLYEAVRECQSMYGASSDFEEENKLDMIYELDLAAAYYIGEGQLKGDKNS